MVSLASPGPFSSVLEFSVLVVRRGPRVLQEPGMGRMRQSVELLEHRRLVRGQDLDLKKGSLGQGGPHTLLGDT